MGLREEAETRPLPAWWMRPWVAGFVAGVASACLFGVWWLGWFPGVLGADGVRQVDAVRSLELSTADPPLHSYLLWALSLGGRALGLFTLLQALGLAALFGLIAVRFTRLGVPAPVAGVLVGLVALLPAVGLAAITVWSEVAFAVVAVWLLAELLALVMDSTTFWSGWRGAVRLGLPLGAAAAFGLEGAITAVVALVAVVTYERLDAITLKRLAAVVLAGIAVGWLVLPLGAERDGGELPTILSPTIAAALVHHPDAFPAADRAFVEQIAPIDVRQNAYSCADPMPLVADRQFDRTIIEADVAGFTGVAMRAVVRHPFTAVGQRACAAVNMLTLHQQRGLLFHLPPYTIPVNEAGVERRPIWFGAFTASKAVLLRTQQTDRLWLWWRPALPLAGAALIYGLMVWRRRREVLTAAVIVGTLLGILLVRPAPDFRTTVVLYVLGCLSAPLMWLAVSPAPSPRPPPPAS